MKFADYFEMATGCAPYLYQENFAAEIPNFVRAPTGFGKTAMVVMGWLWRRNAAPEAVRNATPRRLVYCLPMRALVEQTRQCAQDWVAKLQESGLLNRAPILHSLMGGDDDGDWDTSPECDAVLIGTQDMLLSRALNRGYGASRARWPMQFGLLHTDSLWVFDEIQLMGAGLPTSAQLEAFRCLLGQNSAPSLCQSVWISATLEKKWLATAALDPRLDSMKDLFFDFDAEIRHASQRPEALGKIRARWNAPKPLHKANSAMGEPRTIADEVLACHRESRGRTLVIVNTVARATGIYHALEHALAKERPSSPELVLIHSRFRPHDRKRQLERLLKAPHQNGTICVSTQVAEAGIDVSATTLFTDLAPWASLVQRFGRCNRAGTDHNSRIFWFDPSGGKIGEDNAAPYDSTDLDRARKLLVKCTSGAVCMLPAPKLSMLPAKDVVQMKDLIDLFDTAVDLSGGDIDIEKFVRDRDRADASVFWRDWDGESPPNGKSWRRVGHDEICPVPVFGDDGLQKFATPAARKLWQWGFLDRRWRQTPSNSIRPGQLYLLHSRNRGYDAQLGWAPDSILPVDPVGPQPSTRGICRADDAFDEDGLSHTSRWQTIAQHTDCVCDALEALIASLPLSQAEAAALRTAARWHDWGKAHEVFQGAVADGQPQARRLGKAIQLPARPESWRGCGCIAKAPGKRTDPSGATVQPSFWQRYSRRHFRHELASALALLRPDSPIAAADRDLAAYLIAAHHGKARLSIRSLPKESVPDDPAVRYCRGIWDGDALPKTNLGGGVVAPEAIISLEPLSLGLGARPPFENQPSWMERGLGLRDQLGPFRLAFLEAVLRAADERASAAADTHRSGGNAHAATVVA